MTSVNEVRGSKWRQWLAAFAATSVMLSSNLDIVWATTRRYRSWEKQLFINTSLVTLGAILGAILADTFGRKKILLLASIFPLIGSLSLLIVSPELRWIQLVFTDIGSGITCTVVPLYIYEIADYNIRGALMVLQLLTFTSGTLILDILKVVFRVNHIYQFIGITNKIILFVSTLFFAITLGILPETPHYLYWKKRYHEANRSLGIFKGVNNVRFMEVRSEKLLNVQLNNEDQSWWGKIKEIIEFKNRRSLAMIISLITIKWASGQERNEYSLMSLTRKYFHENNDYFLICIWSVKLIYCISIMFFIDIVGQKLSLLSGITCSCIATIIFVITLKYSYLVAIVSLFVPILCHVFLTAVALHYLGKYFSTNVRAIASAIIISLEVLIRNIILTMEMYFHMLLLLPFFMSVIVFFFGFLFIFIFFPKIINYTPNSEIPNETYNQVEN